MKLAVRVSIAWWVNPYIQAVSLFSEVTGMTPDIDRCVAFAMRGVKLRAER